VGRSVGFFWGWLGGRHTLILNNQLKEATKEKVWAQEGGMVAAAVHP